jgi:toxin ParE1/3/4
MSFILRPAAEADIEEIAAHIAQDNLTAALRWIDDVHRCCGRIATMPRMGTLRSDIRPGLRMFPLGNYLILYLEHGRHVEVVRVLHGARRWQSLL